MLKRKKTHAPKTPYISPRQLTLNGFETPFENQLSVSNRWVVLSKLIPWDEICNVYLKHVGTASTGRPALSPRIAIGSLIIKHICNLDDQETVDQISENMYMQYFLGYSSFQPQVPFDSSLFVEIRKRLGKDCINAINEQILFLKEKNDKPKLGPKNNANEQNPIPGEVTNNQDSNKLSERGNFLEEEEKEVTHKGRVLFDATACPQDIAYPTDLDLLSKARKESEKIIDLLYQKELHQKKPRTYREVARKKYLKTAQKKQKSKKEIRKAVGIQLNYLKRNLGSIDKLLDSYQGIPLKAMDYKTYLVIQTLYQQQKEMYDERKHSVDDRIVSIRQPYVRPIVRGKSQSKTEFGAKIHVSYVSGFVFLDELSWDAFNEGSHLIDYVENYKKRFGYYPQEVLADKIYCTRENRRLLKELEIKLIAKPLGRPSASAVKEYVRPGERNPIEGKFGQAKTGYGMNRIKARLKDTSETWIASIIMVLNLVKLAGEASFYQIFKKGVADFQRTINTILNRLGLIIFGDANICFCIAKPTKVL